MGACPVEERSRVSCDTSRGAGESDGVRSERENAGLSGKSNESPENIIGLSVSVECVGAGESGYERVANAVDLSDEEVGDAESPAEGDVTDAGDSAKVDERIGVELEVSGGVDILASVGELAPPWVLSARNTSSYPISSVRMRSRSSKFSRSRCSSTRFRWRSCSCSMVTTSGSEMELTEGEVAPAIGTPARRRLFSSSSSATLSSRRENCAFLRSREFCAAMRLRCARASLRSSGVTAERGRLRGGWSTGASGESAREDEGDAGRLSEEEEGRERLDGLTKLAGCDGDMAIRMQSTC